MTAIIGAGTFAIVVTLFNFARGDDSEHWPKAMQDNYLESCVSAGASEAGCSCSLGVAEDLYSAGDMRSVEEEVTKTGEAPAELIDAIKSKCPEYAR
jgi:hypothetical protein